MGAQINVETLVARMRELPDAVRAEMTFFPVGTAAEVLAVSLTLVPQPV